METAAPTQHKTSPMMAQWQACKEAAGPAILLFRMGDFYEAFYEDAVVLSKVLDLTLTKRQEIPMAGIPHHTCEHHIDKLISKGFRVAIAEQTEDPKFAKGLVKREVVRVVTPGTVMNSSLIADNANNFIAAIHQVGALYGLAFLDLTTGEFYLIEFDSPRELSMELHRIRPSEILVPERFKEKNTHFFHDLQHSFNFLLNGHDDWRFDHQVTSDFLTSHFNVHTLDGFGLKGMVAGINSGGALLQYIRDFLCVNIGHISTVQTYSTSQYMRLDPISQRNLELAESLKDGSRKNTLLDILDYTCTPMGGRLLRHWTKQPLLAVDAIRQRQDAVETFVKNPRILEEYRRRVDEVRDIERLITKMSTGYGSPRDLIALRNSFQAMGPLKALLQPLTASSMLLSAEIEKITPLPEMVKLLTEALSDDAPVRVSDGKVFRDGYHAELDELRELTRDSKSWLARYQNNLREETGIKTLKVGYTRMFGYYIEVSKGQAERMPDSFQRRQTLVNAERYITPELKDYESKVLTAEERSLAIESELFQHLRTQIAAYSSPILRTSQALAHLDALHSLAEAARKHSYCRPVVDEGQLIDIRDGRHPVIEAVHSNGNFIPNDTILDDDNNRLLLITGPNMAGKSTYIRQVALITIMAQIGSFVPAKSAQIGVVDKVFTRIGASDDLSRGQSTFMVEMTETANILNNVTDRSLVILDEIGRGTSTYDGISIAWSVAEYLLTAEGRMAKTLFATHYWELTKLEEKIPGAVNYNVAVHEDDDQIVFLRKIIKGGTDKSYGIHVGRLAGLPKGVIDRAKEILVHLEENANRKGVFEPAAKPKKKKVVRNELQLSFFG